MTTGVVPPGILDVSFFGCSLRRILEYSKGIPPFERSADWPCQSIFVQHNARDFLHCTSVYCHPQVNRRLALCGCEVKDRWCPWVTSSTLPSLLSWITFRKILDLQEIESVVQIQAVYNSSWKNRVAGCALYQC